MRKLLVIALVAVAISLWMGKRHMQKSPVDSHTDKPITAELPTEGTGFVNVYAARHAQDVEPLFDAFTKETGITVHYITNNAPELISRLEHEAEATPADLLIAVDVSNLDLAKRKELLSEVKSDRLDKIIPPFYRDENRKWFGLGKYVRAIFFRKDAPNKLELKTYQSLTSETFRNKLLLRSSGNAYNQSLIASMILQEGEDSTATWVEGMMRNITRNPEGDDRDQLLAIARGEGDLTIANSYYYARMLTSGDAKERALAEKLGIFIPNQNSYGAHVNISGAGVVYHSKRKENAIKLLEFLAGEEAQKIHANNNHEYPVNMQTKPSEVVESFGSFKGDDASVRKIGDFTARAAELAKKHGWH